MVYDILNLFFIKLKISLSLIVCVCYCVPKVHRVSEQTVGELNYE